MNARRDVVGLDSTVLRTLHVQNALYWDADMAVAAHSAAALTAEYDGVAPGPQANAACTLGQWRLARGDTAVGRFASRLRELGGTGATELEVIYQRCAELLEAWRAAAKGSEDAPARIARLDSLMARGSTQGRSYYAINLALARLLEDGDDLRGALRVLGRMHSHSSDRSGYAATWFRERGRVAALLGDTAAAVHAYRYYLALRAEADPRLQPQVERVRGELARLTEERAGPQPPTAGSR